ncbi:FAD-dependent oxidoreductase [Streptomyces sp. PTM05]|uniref:FAD-dependent oxidoreductase n=1 Tax=Streptantibioticus parmotrematis TaxID=2873249 RepID=A0ABS7R115_9ACTN|nr:FAD-dependent oxidoreductase [Streptantibioticus parmotrematis]MBY8889164.1 FAD-dependent oxidoreductase [Streptantibioticus parmotrematis]
MHATAEERTAREPDRTADVVVVGAGPTGLMLAAELRLAGASVLVLDRREGPGDTPRASGMNGRIVQLLCCRGLLERFSQGGRGLVPSPSIPFGGMQLDLGRLPDSPLQALHLPQPRLERLLDDHARDLGARVLRSRTLTGLTQDESTVTAHVSGPDGPSAITARYLVGCDGGWSRVREAVGIGFPGTAYPEVNRLAQVPVPDAVTLRDDGDLDVPGLGRLRAGFTRTDRGVFAFGALSGGDLLVQTTEDLVRTTEDLVRTTEGEAVADEGDAPMTLDELRASVRRVLGADLPFEGATRLSRYRFQARLAERYRDGRVMLAGDAAHQFPATGIGLNVGMLDAVNLGWKLASVVQGRVPAALLETYHDERRFAGERAMLQTQAQVALRRSHDAAGDALREVFQELCADEGALRTIAALVAGTDVRYRLPNPNGHALTGDFAPDLSLSTGEGTTSVARLLHAARPVLLLLGENDDLREAARGRRDRVDVIEASTEQPPADALLIRPDAHVAWAAAVGEPASSAVPALRDALARWFGEPGPDSAAS